MCASSCSVEQLVTEHVINIAATTHQKTSVVLASYHDLCLTSFVGYMKHGICGHIPIMCGEHYMLEQLVF